MRKGIILAGGNGTRLYPTTASISKQLLPIYDKPMIYYPLSTLMLSGIREIAIISSNEQLLLFKKLLGDGSNFGIKLEYFNQERPEGLAQAFIITEDFLNGDPSALILGDNIFFGNDLTSKLKNANLNKDRITLFCSQVPDPKRFGIAKFSKSGSLSAIIEKPRIPPSNYAVTGLYFLDSRAPDFAKKVKPSKRGELEITSVLEFYIKENIVETILMKRGYAWFDTGTNDSLLRASNFVQTIQSQQGLMIACLEEIALYNEWVSVNDLEKITNENTKSDYAMYLRKLIN